jgi:ATP phosphoribosyltransferase
VTTTPAEPKKTKLIDRIVAKIKSLVNKKEKTTTSPAAPTPAVTKATAQPTAPTTTPAAPVPANAVPATAATA